VEIGRPPAEEFEDAPRALLEVRRALLLLSHTVRTRQDHERLKHSFYVLPGQGRK